MEDTRPVQDDAHNGPGIGPAEAADRRPTEPAPPIQRGLVGALSGVLAVIVIVAAYLLRDRAVLPSHYVLLSLLLFTIGAFGVLMRRNALVLFMCIELMLNAVNIAFVAFARMHGSVDGHVIVLFVIIVAAAEVAVGLGIIVSIFRRRMSADVDDVSLLRW